MLWRLQDLGTWDNRKRIVYALNQDKEQHLLSHDIQNQFEMGTEEGPWAEWRFMDASNAPDEPGNYDADLVKRGKDLRDLIAKLRKRIMELKKLIKALKAKLAKMKSGKRNARLNSLQDEIAGWKKKKKTLEEFEAELKELIAEQARKQQEKFIPDMEREFKVGECVHREVVHAGMRGPKCPDPELHKNFEITWDFLTDSGTWKAFPKAITQIIEVNLEDKKDNVQIEHEDVFFFVYIRKRQCVACETGEVMTIRRRKPAIKTETIHPGALGAGDKAIKGDDLSLGEKKDRAPLEYELLLKQHKYMIPEDYLEEAEVIDRTGENRDRELDPRLNPSQIGIRGGQKTSQTNQSSAGVHGWPLH